MIIIEIIFAKINNPQQNTKYFSKKMVSTPGLLGMCNICLLLSKCSRQSAGQDSVMTVIKKMKKGSPDVKTLGLFMFYHCCPLKIAKRSLK